MVDRVSVLVVGSWRALVHVGGEEAPRRCWGSGRATSSSSFFVALGGHVSTLSPQVVGFPAPFMPSSLSLRPVLCGSAFWLMSCGVGASSVVAPVMSGEWVFRRAKTCRVFDGSHGAFSAPCLGSTSPCDFLARSARAADELCRQVSRGCLVCCCGQTKCCADRPNARADGFAMKFAGGCPRVGGCSCRR